MKLMPPPSVLVTWPKANYVNPYSRSDSVFYTNTVMLFFGTLFVAIRLYTRIVIRRWFGMDDALIAFAYVGCLFPQITGFPLNSVAVQILYLAALALTFYGFKHYGWGRHVWDVPFVFITRAYSPHYRPPPLFANNHKTLPHSSATRYYANAILYSHA